MSRIPHSNATSLSEYLLMRKVDDLKSLTVAKAVEMMLAPYVRHSMTFDNVSEFAKHERITARMPADESLSKDIPLESLDFHPDGCVPPAVIELELDSRVTRYRIEPFSGSLAPDSTKATL